MNSVSSISNVSSVLSEWYRIHQRDLPWRQNPDPYLVWLSEIILQQTRVEQGLPYFETISQRFPDIQTLANAPLDDLLKLWQGLGYYSRARNLHTAAKQVMKEFGGHFPSTYNQLLRLKGVGEYTAAAIASIAYGEARAVVDGNVFRVLSRVYGLDTPINSTEGKQLFTSLAEELLDRGHPSRHNQALMDFGALQCTPSSPDCGKCPLADQCIALATGRISELPVKLPGAAKQNRFFFYLVLTDGTNTWLRKRMDKDIWQNLWEFPLVETLVETPLEHILQDPLVQHWLGKSFVSGKPVRLKHVLSHRIIHATFLPVRMLDKGVFPEDWQMVPLDRIDSYAVSRMTENFLSKEPLE
jgi:A/G-specific adenine glycosylase